MKTIVIVFIIALMGFAAGCSKQSGDTSGNPQQPPVGTSCDGVNAKFADVLPIFQATCATSSGCHGNGSNRGPGALTNFAEIKDAASRIKIAVNSGRMPLTGSLTSAELKQINCWVDNGALNN